MPEAPKIENCWGLLGCELPYYPLAPRLNQLSIQLFIWRSYVKIDTGLFEDFCGSGPLTNGFVRHFVHQFISQSITLFLRVGKGKMYVCDVMDPLFLTAILIFAIMFDKKSS